jgi:hypothetical protein
MATDAKIHDVATAYIRKSVCGRTDWPFTVIGELHPSLLSRLSLAEGELTLVSAFFSNDSWYAFTTRRILSQLDGKLQSIDPSQSFSADFGNFKGYGPREDEETIPEVGVVPREIATITANSGTVLRFEFATWEESTLPMSATQYWWDKHPFIDKLMTTAELEHYKKNVALPRTPRGRPEKPPKDRALNIVRCHEKGVVSAEEAWTMFLGTATPQTLPEFMAEFPPELRQYFQTVLANPPDRDKSNPLLEALSRWYNNNPATWTSSKPPEDKGVN